MQDVQRIKPFLQSLPGQKIIMKGNHDYWWSTANKMNAYLKAEAVSYTHLDVYKRQVRHPAVLPPQLP